MRISSPECKLPLTCHVGVAPLYHDGGMSLPVRLRVEESVWNNIEKTAKWTCHITLLALSFVTKLRSTRRCLQTDSRDETTWWQDMERRDEDN